MGDSFTAGVIMKLVQLYLLLVLPVFPVVAETVGELSPRGTFVSTGQSVRPAGDAVAFPGRPVDLAVSPDGYTVFVKNTSGLVVLDVKSWAVRQTLASKDGNSMHGVAVTADGQRVYVTTAGNWLLEAVVDAAGQLTWGRRIELPGKGASYPCGLAVRGQRAYVALSRNNSLAVVNLDTGKVESEIPVGVAPFAVVLSPAGDTAYVSNWGGRQPQAGERALAAAGTLVDERGIPCSGTISKISLAARQVIAEVAVGLHPSALALRHEGTELFVANANSDTVSVIETKAFRVVETVRVRPDAALPFGSITCGLVLSSDEQTLYACNGGNNAIAVIALGAPSVVRGYIPTGWFPSAVAIAGERLFVVNTKGDGTPWPHPDTRGKHAKWFRGTVSQIGVPDAATLARQTAQVCADGLVPQALRAFEKGQAGIPPVPVPARVGEPSVFEHVVYVLKENRTYDQVFGDLPYGNNDPQLCIYGRSVTPNHHALAEQFVLLDNYYCNGVVSADGHQWATQGITTDYQEKMFGGAARNYDFGTDPLAFAPTDFIWDNALLHGRSFRNYGEFDWPNVVPAAATWADVAAGRATFTHSVSIAPLRAYTATNYPGWNLKISDTLRIDRFLEEFRQFEIAGNWPNLVFVYLPQDHTAGKSGNAPTPRAHLADNDLALGRLVAAISKSQFWSNTCIVVNEDDPQDGFDHVDGHRSLCLVISPYTKRSAVVSQFYNQTSVLHTIERILGLPPMNQLDALAPTMEACFTAKPDFTQYTALPNTIPLDEMPNGAPDHSAPSALTGHKAPVLAPSAAGQSSLEFDLSRPDRINDDVFNRVLWHEAKGAATPYPVQFTGAHGRGLKALGLRLDSATRPDADD